MEEDRSFKGKLEKALLWACTVAAGSIVLNVVHNEPFNWDRALLAGLTVGALNLLWSVISEKLKDIKGKKKR
ncbi:MAG: hypothetical protein OSJ69_05680 [Acetatifactor sp.]|nr:hypothetical protein [Acetatifactor sp.]